MQFLGDILEVNHGVDVQCGLRLLWQDMLADIFLETATELRDILYSQREAYGISMSSEVQQQVATTLDGIIEVVAGYTACRTCSYTVEFRQHHRRTVIEFRES